MRPEKGGPVYCTRNNKINGNRNRSTIIWDQKPEHWHMGPEPGATETRNRSNSIQKQKHELQYIVTETEAPVYRTRNRIISMRDQKQEHQNTRPETGAPTDRARNRSTNKRDQAQGCGYPGSAPAPHVASPGNMWRRRTLHCHTMLGLVAGLLGWCNWLAALVWLVLVSPLVC